MQIFRVKCWNKQQSITDCTVYSHSLYIAAYPGAEVLLLILAWLQIINGKKGSSFQADWWRETLCIMIQLPLSMLLKNKNKKGNYSAFGSLQSAAITSERSCACWSVCLQNISWTNGPVLRKLSSSNPNIYNCFTFRVKLIRVADWT